MTVPEILVNHDSMSEHVGRLFASGGDFQEDTVFETGHPPCKMTQTEIKWQGTPSNGANGDIKYGLLL